MNTSWDSVSEKYDKTVGKDGSYYHRSLVLPEVLKMLYLKKGDSLLDAGCGQGIFERYLPEGIKYAGIDSSKELISLAVKSSKYPTSSKFFVADLSNLNYFASAPTRDTYTHAVLILALQNMTDIDVVFKNISKHLADFGKLVVVINHPCFRMPRHSSWEKDPNNEVLFRKVGRYMTPYSIAITANPGETKKVSTFSFHYPLSVISGNAFKAGFVIEKIEEWVSDKKSVGKHARSENTAREEIPLFMALKFRKVA